MSLFFFFFLLLLLHISGGRNTREPGSMTAQHSGNCFVQGISASVSSCWFSWRMVRNAGPGPTGQAVIRRLHNR